MSQFMNSIAYILDCEYILRYVIDTSITNLLSAADGPFTILVAMWWHRCTAIDNYSVNRRTIPLSYCTMQAIGLPSIV
jgi:hypothetical protein